MRIFCVIPAHNEERCVGEVAARAAAALPAGATVIVVDDGSGDATAERARGAGALVVRNPFPLGYGAAIQTGVRLAARLGADAVVTLDGDGQHVPEDIPALLAPLQRGEAEVVVGCRYAGPGAAPTYPVPWARRWGHRFFSWLVRRFTGLQIRDPTSGFQALSAGAVRFVLSDAWPPDYPDADVLISYAWMGLRVVEREVRFQPPQDERKSMHAGPLRALWYLYAMGLSLLRVAVTAVELRRRGAP